MQAMSHGLTQYDVEELVDYCGGKFTQGEIEGLYTRFRSLDRGHKGYISADEFLNIPELSINPLARRLERLFDTVNFKDFVGFLSTFSRRATREDQLRFLFSVHDMDGDGILSKDDLELMLRQLAGSSLSLDYIQMVVEKAFKDAGVSKSGLSYEEFEAAMEGSRFHMHVDVPTD